MNKNFTVEGQIVDIENKNIFPGKIHVENGIIKEIEHCAVNNENYILPGFIDAHVHIESSMLVPENFAKIAAKHGTVACVADPHEIANICGIDGLNFMIESAKNAPIKFYFGLPSCVPATQFESSGAELNVDQIIKNISRNDIYFLAEMMNFPGVINNNEDVLGKINAAKNVFKPIDGHAPVSNAEVLRKYAQAGISSDHETTTMDEAFIKLELGMKIQIREGSAAKNFKELYTLIDMYPDQIMFCTDDIHPDDLMKQHINFHVKNAIEKGQNIFNVLKAASINPVTHYKLDVGLCRKNDKADFIIVDNLKDFTVLKTCVNGIEISDNRGTKEKNITINVFKTDKIVSETIAFLTKKEKINLIQCFDGSLLTKKIVYQTGKNSDVYSVQNDILKIVVKSRYSNQPPGIGFIQGFGLQAGAIGASVAHDSHNIIAVGTNDDDITEIINQIIENKGGLGYSLNRKTELLTLPVAGIMSDSEPGFVAQTYEYLNNYAKITLKSKLLNPYMTLSFMALLVIPEIKMSDRGIFDSENFAFINLEC